MSDMKCPMCGEMLQKYGEVDPDAGTSIVLGANCPKCGIGNSDIKLWQELIRTRKALEIAVDALKELKPQKAKGGGYWAVKSTDAIKLINTALEQITTLEQKEEK